MFDFLTRLQLFKLIMKLLSITHIVQLTFGFRYLWPLPISWEIFLFDWLNGRSHATSRREGLSNIMQEMKIQHSHQTRLGFYVETRMEKITRRRERKNSLSFICVTRGFLFTSIRLFFFLLSPPLRRSVGISKLFGITDGADPSPWFMIRD